MGLSRLRFLCWNTSSPEVSADMVHDVVWSNQHHPFKPRIPSGFLLRLEKLAGGVLAIPGYRISGGSKVPISNFDGQKKAKRLLTVQTPKSHFFDSRKYLARGVKLVKTPDSFENEVYDNILIQKCPHFFTKLTPLQTGDRIHYNGQQEWCELFGPALHPFSLPHQKLS